MSRTINLRTAFTRELKNIHQNVFYEVVPEGATFPYIVFSLEAIGEKYQIEINIYDKNTSTATVESLTDEVYDYFKRYIYRDDEQVFTTYFNTRNNVEEDDKSIKRRRLLLDINYLWKEM